MTTNDYFLPNCYVFGFVTSGYNEDVSLSNMGAMPIYNASGLVAFIRRLISTKIKPEEHYRDIEIRLLNDNNEGILLIEFEGDYD